MESQTAEAIDVGSVRIRDAQHGGREFIIGLVPELLAFDSPPPWRDRQHMTAIDVRAISGALDGTSQGTRVFVAEEARGHGLGFVHLCEGEDYYGGACGHAGDIVVAPAARGRGVGRALLAAAERWAREQGYRMLTLNVFLKNEKARALYEDLGYEAETVRHVKNPA